VYESRAWPKDTFLSLLPARERADLFRLGTLYTVGPRRTLVRQGEPGGSVWLLVDALVKVTARVENGTEALLALRVSGDLIGEMAVLGETVRSATVVTCRRAVVCQIRGDAFVAFLRRHPSVSLTLNQMMIGRLRWSNQRRLDFAGYATGQCLARVLLELADRHGRPCDLGVDLGVPISQAELGGLVGAKEDTVQRTMRALAAEGLVANLGRRHVVITDRTRLAAFADLA